MNPSLVLISISLFTWGIGEGMFWYFQPIYLDQLGANTMTIAGVFSAVGVAMMMAHIPAGYLSDKIGRRPVLWFAWAFGVVSAWTMALAGNLRVFIIGMVLYGLTAFVSSPLFSYVTAARGKLTSARAMTLTSAAYNLGAIIGPITGGWIGNQYGLKSIYYVVAIIFVVSLIILFFLKAQPRDNHDPNQPPIKLLKNKRFLTILALSFSSVFIMYLAQPLTPKFLEVDRGISLSQIGLIGSVGSIGSVTMNLVLGQMSPRIGFILAQALVGLFAILLWKGNSVFWFGLGYFLLGGYRAARVLIFAQISSIIKQFQMGLAYGVTETLNSFAIMLSPLLAGWLYTQNPESVFIVAFGLVVVSIIASMIVTPRIHPDPVIETE
ncbi:MAG: MFS transporter [Anaerolineales bacterium]